MLPLSYLLPGPQQQANELGCDSCIQCSGFCQRRRPTVRVRNTVLSVCLVSPTAVWSGRLLPATLVVEQINLARTNQRSRFISRARKSMQLLPDFTSFAPSMPLSSVRSFRSFVRQATRYVATSVILFRRHVDDVAAVACVVR